MFGAWMVRIHHVPKEQVAIWLGSWGIVASLAGSFAGGPTIIPDDAGQTIVKHFLYLVVALGLIGPLAVGLGSDAAPDPFRPPCRDG